MKRYIGPGVVFLIICFFFTPASGQIATGFCASTSSQASHYSCNLSPAIQAYSLGTQYTFRANSANINPVTMALNGLPPVAVVKTAGGVTTQLSVNDIRNNQLVVVIFDGANMQMMSPLGNEPVPAGLRLISTLAAGCPTGWTEDTTARGRYLVGNPASGTVGATLGDVMTQTAGTVDDVSKTPAGTNGTVSFTPVGTIAAISATGTAALVTASAAGQDTANQTHTHPAPVFTGTAGTVSAQAFTGTADTTVRSTVAPTIQVIICSKS